ncbi:MAG: FtsW/RodA/SpoVE family cell cycle protein [Patescibacteria group bacterium]|nr:FtsW/RodA/SpoVE family cell cycle protein [Patescibacteria group bacterium]
MWTRIKLYLQAFDWLLLAAAVLLSAFGLMEIYSVALGQGDLNLLNFYKQILFVSIGLVLMFIFTFIDYRFLKSIRSYLYVIGALLLVAVLVLGSDIRGTRGWFYIAGFGIQPVEIIKLILLIFLSGYFADLATRVKTLRHFVISALSVGFLVFLVLLQPDFGSALILGAIWLVLVILAGFPRKYLVAIFASALILFVLAWSFFFKPYQKNRVLTFVNPGDNALVEGYNISQAIIAVGSGSWYGKGVGLGSQSQLKFLPEAQNDFIFAVIAEELGFFGVSLVLLFFSLYFSRCLAAVKRLPNDFSTYFVLGAMGLIFIQMFINIGMNIGIMPVVGLSLPFISYGGSSIFLLFILTGIIENIIIKSKINY